MMFNFMHGNPTEINFKLTLDTRGFNLYEGNFAGDYGIETCKQIHHRKNHLHCR